MQGTRQMGKLASGSGNATADNYLFFHMIYGSRNAGDFRLKSAVQFQNMTCSTPNYQKIICPFLGCTCNN